MCILVKFLYQVGGALFFGPSYLQTLVTNMAKEKKERDETTAEGVLDAFLPGIGRLISNLNDKSPALKQRLEETDKEIERRIAAGGSRSVRTPFSSLEVSKTSRKPVIDYNIRVRTLAPEHDTTTSFKSFVKKGEQKSYSSKPKPRDADVFDENDKIVVIVELSGVKKEEIVVKINGSVVEISAKEYHERINLPCEVTGKPVIKFKNGILELRLAKKGK